MENINFSSQDREYQFTRIDLQLIFELENLFNLDSIPFGNENEDILFLIDKSIEPIKNSLTKHGKKTVDKTISELVRYYLEFNSSKSGAYALFHENTFLGFGLDKSIIEELEDSSIVLKE